MIEIFFERENLSAITQINILVAKWWMLDGPQCNGWILFVTTILSPLDIAISRTKRNEIEEYVYLRSLMQNQLYFVGKTKPTTEMKIEDANWRMRWFSNSESSKSFVDNNFAANRYMIKCIGYDEKICTYSILYTSLS